MGNMKPSTPRQPLLFEQASRVFEGWEDSETGLRVLKIAGRDCRLSSLAAAEATWGTAYHQSHCFLAGGRKVLLNAHPLRESAGTSGPPRTGFFLMDLGSGEASCPFPDDGVVIEVWDATDMALVLTGGDEDSETALWDVARQEPAASFRLPGWHPLSTAFLSDGRRMIAGFSRGPWRKGKCHSVHHLVSADGGALKILDADGWFCNHVTPCPTDPDLYAYDRWPTPYQWIETVIHTRRVDGTCDAPLPMREGTVRPGPILDCQRDHYVWTPDGTRITSYLLPQAEDFSGNHYHFRWWISVLNLRTGEDLTVPYPPDRWGGNSNVTPDSRFIVSGGGQDFDYLYAIEIEGLRAGWNERPLCCYPGSPADQFFYSVNHHPHVLPDMSGVIFTAGHKTPQQGVYMVEVPEDMRAAHRA